MSGSVGAGLKEFVRIIRVDMQNSERVLSKAIQALSLEFDVTIESLSSDWIYRLTRGGNSRFIFGYDFDLNSAATHLIAKDKSALSDILALDDIPRVEHRLFHHPNMRAYVPHAGNWAELVGYFKSTGFDAVCKPNTGTGGNDVSRVRNQLQLEEIVHALFDKGRSLAVSPYVDIDTEYRVILLDRECLLMYRKDRASVVGDGRSRLIDLMLSTVASMDKGALQKRLKHLDFEDPELFQVIPRGTTRYLNWRHNLGQGASATIINPSTAEGSTVLALALRAAGSINLAFGSVDVVNTAKGLQILEINSGVMVESLSQIVPDGMTLAMRIYRRAIAKMLQIL